MKFSAVAASVADIQSWRDVYRQEMNCQIVHDSLHSREGWTESYMLSAGGSTVGYGAVAVGGPWKGKPTVFEFYVVPQHRGRLFDLFSALLAASGARMIETQSNDVLLTVMLHAFADSVASESVLFHDKFTTAHLQDSAVFRRTASGDAAKMPALQLDPTSDWVLDVAGETVAAGGVLFHYNRPYGDVYMQVAEPFRRRGFGAYLVQELKRVCYEQGSVPAARCNPKNVASRKTLQKAGFVPCGHILVGAVAAAPAK
jgi:GNAT superfamily N-acetyltransferase